MLRQFLETIHTGEVQSLLEIAHKLGISPEMVLQMAKDLTNRGYLQEIGSDCEAPQNGCPDCPVNNTCQVIVKHWFLIEKGRTAVSGAITK
jgi:DNA-binding Lrp family transcriptional regulator